MAVYTNYYRCEDCDVEWIDEWSCACDDECPECGKDFSPFEYEVEGGDEDEEGKDDWTSLEGKLRNDSAVFALAAGSGRAASGGQPVHDG